MVASYLATAMATTKSLEGTFFVGDVTGSKVFPEQQQNTRYIGQTWHTWTYQEPIAKPAKGGLLEFVYIPASSTSGIVGGGTTVSFPDSVAQVYLTKTVHVTCNGVTIDLNFQADYTENTNIGEIRHRNFYIDGDVFGLSSKIGQTLEYKIWWD